MVDDDNLTSQPDSEPETVLLEIIRDDWVMILDYIYGNLEWDEDSDGKRAMYDAMRRIRNAHHLYHVQEKSEPGVD